MRLPTSYAKSIQKIWRGRSGRIKVRSLREFLAKQLRAAILMQTLVRSQCVEVGAAAGMLIIR